MANTLECPYCEASLDDPDDCYAPETPYQHQCDSCQKHFIFYIEYDPDYQPKKADCLNGAEHQWSETATYPRQYTKLVCSGCHKTVPVSPERKAELIKEDEAQCAKVTRG